jgi:hypothetical protein
MSFLPRSPLPSDQAFEGAQERREKAIEQGAMLDQNDEGVSEDPRNSGIAGRLRSVLRRGRSSTRPPEAEVSDEDVWERERHHRREHEQDRLDGSG